jgi:hypothetical protein
MAKRKARGGAKKAGRAAKKARTPRKPARKMSKTASRKTSRKTSRKASQSAKRPKAARRATTLKSSARKPSRHARSGESAAPAGKMPRLNRPRRTLDDTVPTPPSSLNMNRQGSAARTGRAELLENQQVHGAMTRGITGGDVDVNLEQAYFSGDETPGGDNPTPDQDVVEDIGRAIGIEYQDNEELRASDKVADRDKHRWELDPASAEDYKERK